MPTEYLHKINPRDLDVTYFFGASSAAAGNVLWMPFHIPKNSLYLWMTVAGAASGGAGGHGNQNNATGYGGAGGASGGIANLFILAEHLPRIIYVSVCLGGLGGTAGSFGPGGSGGNGARTIISAKPNSTAVADIILISGTVASVGGVGGSLVGGIGETIATLSQSNFCGMGEWSATVGQSGAAGNDGAPGVAIVWGATGSPVSGGGGGSGWRTPGSTGGSGGDVTGAGLMPTTLGGVGVTGTNPINGAPGANGWSYFGKGVLFASSGGGGGCAAPNGAQSTVNANGGRGGNGGFASGGGGGGAAEVQVGKTPVGGVGGQGGSGLAMIGVG